MCIAAAVVGGAVVTSAVGANAQKKAASSAASAETAAADAQIAESRRQFDQIRKLLQPYVSAGTGALGQQQSLLGLSGAPAQQQAIQALQNSPQFRALTQSGENAILQNASATGGLRGGNVQAALAQFRPQVLSSLIESQYSNLGGLSSLGQNAAVGVGNAGLRSTGQINQALSNIGSAQAGAALARGNASAGLAGTIGQGLGLAAGSGVFGGGSPATIPFGGFQFGGSASPFVGGTF